MASQDIQHFFHPQSGTISYVVSDKATREAIIIDPVADYDVDSGKIAFDSVQEILNYIEEHQLHVSAIMETHIHSDHLTGSFYLSEKLGAPINVAEGVKEVYSQWKDDLLLKDLYEFEHLLLDQEHLEFGDSDLEVLHTPGHSECDMTFKIGNAMFVGDALFHKESVEKHSGVAGEHLYQALTKLYNMEESTHVYLGHECSTGGEKKLHGANCLKEGVKPEAEPPPAVCLPEQQRHDKQILKSAISYNLTAKLP
ncbi:MBL fold metallo-hydrolase [Vibrio sonorensis]|uniref:MBL fold metallo-hydrolase n=1 Tax=Vibrio sonorensis TaxID=1004316 RepID=UPI0008DA1015|nr:MBL fold metallo-hydrolase [Vibrio sonorensis]